ncbi:MAG TPA: NAD(P)/FAD-dependent oxidoreductase [Solirubrobacteraceae bacterium]|nr:NAD(P)/FAD-dependent oxidoreductase [Solirubrobacteraceae bacterium]
MAEVVEERPAGRSRPSVLIVGAGFGGVGAAIELLRSGFRDVRILERAPDLGGTWHYNDYPGAACDVPSHLYSFSYAQRTDWSRLCSPRGEIHDYLRDIAREWGVDRLIEFGRTVDSCRWDEEQQRWEVATSEGASYEAHAIVLATGQLHRPSYPALAGIESFGGHSFHSSRWDHSYRLGGRRVAVVGTGASAVQFVPEIAPEVESLKVFQRTGNWFLPRRDRRYPAAVRRAIEVVPGLQGLRRRFVFDYTESLTLMIRHPNTVGRIGALSSALFMRRQLRDPELRRRAWPHYTFGCKRILFSSQYLPTLARANVELVTESIAGVEERGLRTADGKLHEVDCIIWGTGFQSTEFMFPMEIAGREGRSLREEWAQGPRAHLGICVSGFPNMFLMYGPNTNTSGGSIIFFEEAQAAYLRQALQALARRGGGSIEVRPEVQEAGDREMQARFPGTAWTRCDSWYRNERGRIVTNWPGYMREYAQRTRELDEREYAIAGPVRAQYVSLRR